MDSGRRTQTRSTSSIGGDNNDLYNKVQAGELDFVVDGAVPPQVLRQYSTDPTLQPLLHINPSDAVRYISFNMAVPPFDDVNVRKAVNLAFDKDGMRTLRGGESVGEIAGHIMVNSLENNLLAGLRPVRHTEQRRRHRGRAGGDGAVGVRHGR